MKKNILVKNSFIVFMFIVFIAVTLFSCMVSVSNLFANKNLVNNVNNGEFKIVSSKADNTVENLEDVYNEINKNKKKLDITNANEQLKYFGSNVMEIGVAHKFKQYYEGVEVFGRELSVIVSANNVFTFSGNFLGGLKIQSMAKLNTEEALNVAKNFHINEKVSSLQNIIYSLNGYTPSYCVKVNFESGAYAIVDSIKLQEITFILGANTYDVLSGTTSINTTQTDLSGNPVSVDIEKDGHTYYLFDAKRNIYILNSNNTETVNGKLYSGSTNTFNDGTAVSALKNFVLAYDFYANKDNVGVSRLGIDGKNDDVHGNMKEKNEQIIYVNVHVGKEYQNAFYNQDSDAKKEIFGIGDGKMGELHSFAGSLDVIGHEYQHAITNCFANLIYLNESGALSEAISDIFGALIENEGELKDDNFWLIGEDITSKRALRDMKTPSTLGDPESMDDAKKVSYCYLTTNHAYHGCDNGGVHSNSSIINKANYLIYKNAPDIFTKQVMGKLWFNALALMNSNTNFKEMYEILIKTANLLTMSEKSTNAIKLAFVETKIILDSDAMFEVQFNATDADLTGLLPANMRVKNGSTFKIEACNLVKNEQHYLFGWYVTGGKTDLNSIYIVGKEYVMSSADISLFPLFLPKMWGKYNEDPAEIATSYTLKGEGTGVSPYSIYTAEDLAYVAFYFNNRFYYNFKQDLYDKKFVLKNDIDLENKQWIPIGAEQELPFKAKFDGNYYKINNLLIDQSTSFHFLALFGVAGQNSEIKNLTIESGSVDGRDTLTSMARDSAGLVGLLQGNISNIVNKATIKSAAYAGGIVGEIFGVGVIISNCYNEGLVTSKQVAGGIVAAVYSVGLEKGEKTAYSNFLGNCYNSGTVTGVTVGGIVGQATCISIANCINTGTVNVYMNSDFAKCGGIVGSLNEQIEVYSEYATISLENSILSGCKNTGKINPTNSSYSKNGGIVGAMFATGTKGEVIFEKNVMKSNGVSDIGNRSGFTASMLEMLNNKSAATVDDELYSGAFDFDNEEYLKNVNNWFICSWSGYFDVGIEWKIVAGQMPQLKSVEYWLNFASESFAKGDGSKGNPYKVTNAFEFARVTKMFDEMTFEQGYDGEQNYLYFQQDNDIDLAGKAWVGAGGEYIQQGLTSTLFKGFVGYYNGNGFEIKNMSSRGYSVYEKVQNVGGEDVLAEVKHGAGLFSSIGGGYGDVTFIENVKLTNAFSMGFNVGAICEIMNINSTVKNSSASGNVLGVNTAGFVGRVSGDGQIAGKIVVENCENKANIYGEKVGGIVGAAISRNNSNAEIFIIGNDIRGKLLGFSNNNIGKKFFVGGIIGHIQGNNVTVSGNRSLGDIASYAYTSVVGGIVGGVGQSEEPMSVNLNIINNYAGVKIPKTSNENQLTDVFIGGIEKLSNKKTNTICIEDNFYLDEEETVFNESKFTGFICTLQILNNSVNANVPKKNIYNYFDFYMYKLWYSEADLPTLPTVEGYDKTAPYWVETIKDGNVVFDAVYKINEYIINFFVDDVIYKTITVKHGEQFIMPNISEDIKVDAENYKWNYDMNTVDKDTDIKLVKKSDGNAEGVDSIKDDKISNKVIVSGAAGTIAVIGIAAVLIYIKKKRYS